MKRNLLELWIKDRLDENEKLQIGENLRIILGLDPENLTFYFKDHTISLAVFIC
jgi:translation initiation factor 4E